ncbi:MAG: hypothetical protein M3385_04015 [Actinomycetota bacterium]|nr:hypothetical protein [Actinomycetota bacterium]
MSPRVTSWLARSLAAFCVALFLAAVALHIATLPVQPPSSWGTGGISTPLWAILPFLPFPIVGALIASRRPRNPIGWISLAVGIAWMLTMVTGSYVLYGLRMARPGSVPYPAAVGSLSEFLGPTAILLGTFLILLFPDGRLPSRRWRPVAWLCGAVIASSIVVTILAPGKLSELRNVANPFGLEGHPWLADANNVIGLLFPLCLLASASSLILRYLRAGEEVREQIKWLAFAASVVAFGVSGAVIHGTFFSSDATGSSNPLLGNLLQDSITLSFSGVPVAIGFAVLKYRLYDIDILINRALVYGSLTVMLATVYFGGVTATQAIFQTFTGQDNLPQLAVVASTLVIAALFNPVRRRIQSFIDRRFYRRKYDARKTLEAFSAKLRDETDLDSLNADLVTVVGETLQPAHVSLWLRPDTPQKGEKAD